MTSLDKPDIKILVM